MIDNKIWSGLERGLLSGDAADLDMLLALVIQEKSASLTKQQFGTALPAAFGAIIATMVLLFASEFQASAFALGLILLLHFVLLRRVDKTRSDFKRVLMAYQGGFLEEPLQKNGYSKEQVMSTLSAKGVASLDHISALELEESASLHVFYSDARPTMLLKAMSRKGTGVDNGAIR